MATLVRIWSGDGCQGPRRQIHANAKYRVTDHALQSCDIGLGRPRLWDSHVHPWHHHEIGQDEHHQCEDQRLGDTGLKQPPAAPNRDEQQPVGNADDVVRRPQCMYAWYGIHLSQIGLGEAAACYWPMREAVSFTSACSHALLKRASITSASASFFCARRACSRPKRAQPLSRLRCRSSQ